jgi:hypothetical protein
MGICKVLGTRQRQEMSIALSRNIAWLGAGGIEAKMTYGMG